MKSNKFKIFFLIFSISFQFVNAQQVKDTLTNIKTENIKFNYKQLIIPTILIGYGAIGIESDGLKFINSGIKEEVNENIDKKITIDDFSQYAPALSVYALNFAGIKGKNNLRDRSIILGTSYLLVGTSVYALKNITKEERPDKSGFNSFPSGHTATAFAGDRKSVV